MKESRDTRSIGEQLDDDYAATHGIFTVEDGKVVLKKFTRKESERRRAETKQKIEQMEKDRAVNEERLGVVSKIPLSRLRAIAEAEQNEPLTIEQILNMNGKPVWCQTGDGYEGWALVIIDKYQDGGHYLYLFSDDLTRGGINEAFEPDEDFINLKFSDDPNGHFGLHVLGWRAYRYEPKGAHQ